MDLQLIKTFIHVAKTENLSKTAEELSYAQSTVTMQLQRLEKELGFPLFERIGRKNYLTAAGKEFLIYAEEILHITEKAKTIGQDMKTMKGTINIGVLESLLFSKLMHILSAFKSKFCNLQINIKIGQTIELKELLKQNKLDIIYISADEDCDTELKCCFKKKEELVFAVSNNHPLATGKKLSSQQIFKFPFIVTEPSGYCYKRLGKIASDENCKLYHSIVIDSVSAIKKLLAEGQNVAFLPRYSLKNELVNGELCTINTSIPAQFYYSQLLCTRDKWMSPFMEELIEDIRTNLY